MVGYFIECSECTCVNGGVNGVNVLWDELIYID